MANINEALKIRHPTADALYYQGPPARSTSRSTRTPAPASRRAWRCSAAAALWLSATRSFAINGWPIVQTVTQAMAELRRTTPATVCLFTAGALEQGRNGWTHQRPEIENYFAAQMRNGNVYPLFPADANMIQAATTGPLKQHNKGIVIIASKSPLPVHATMAQSHAGDRADGAMVLQETRHGLSAPWCSR